MKTTFVIITILLVSSLPFLSVGNVSGNPASAISPTPSPVEFVFDPAITPVYHFAQASGATVQPYTESMADGRVIDVREITICQETNVYGSPSADSTVRYSLKKGAKVFSHERWGGWVMLKAANWIPESVVCGH